MSFTHFSLSPVLLEKEYREIGYFEKKYRENRLPLEGIQREEEQLEWRSNSAVEQIPEIYIVEQKCNLSCLLRITCYTYHLPGIVRSILGPELGKNVPELHKNGA